MGRRGSIDSRRVPTAESRGGRRHLDDLLLPEALDEGLPELDALSRGDQRPIRETQADREMRVASRPRRRGRRTDRCPVHRAATARAHAATSTRYDRDQAGRSHASSMARRDSPLSGSERSSGRVSMRRPPSPPLTSRARRWPGHPEDRPIARIDVETRHDARRQVDGLQLVRPEREPLAAERRGDPERRDALGARPWCRRSGACSRSAGGSRP